MFKSEFSIVLHDFSIILANSECYTEFARMIEGFYHALEDLKPDKAFVVYQGKERYPISENIEAINLVDLAMVLSGLPG